MKGFTLVEMLVALLIFGLISAAGVSILSFTLDNQQMVRARSHRLGELQRTRSALKGDLAQAAARRTRGVDGRVEPRVLAGGDPAVGGPLLQLVRRGWDNPDAAPRASLQAVEYRLTDGRLERRSRAALDGAAWRPAQVLLTGVRRAHVSFRVGGQWIDTLPNATQQPLPQAVRLDLTLDDYGALSQAFVVTGEAS